MEFLNQVLQGDCLEVMRNLPDNSVDCLISDPPSSISFMGKDWDSNKGGAINWINWLSEILHEAMRAMKPGACGAIWSLPRVCGYTQLAIELAGLRIWESVAVVTGQGFPKAQDIGMMIDRLYNAKGEITGYKSIAYPDLDVLRPITTPVTPKAQQWDGWKTPALKPAHETWFLIQKPISESSIARNVLKWGTGGVNVKACRIPSPDKAWGSGNRDSWREAEGRGDRQRHRYGEPDKNPGMRFPANLILQCSPDCTTEKHAEHCPVEIMGRQSGFTKNGGSVLGQEFRDSPVMMHQGIKVRTSEGFPGDSGTASRYFLNLSHDPDTFIYLPKASKSDRTCNGTVPNIHPTVKPRNLMAYFAKLLCPPNGIILDPFAGSGTTALAAIQEGFNYILIEQDPEYIEIIHKRIAATRSKVEQPIASLLPESSSDKPQTGNGDAIEKRVDLLEKQVKANRRKIRKIEDGMVQLGLFDAS